MLRSLVAVAAIVAVSLPLAASGNMVRPQLNAKVTARSISLTDAKGDRVRVLLQNEYRIVVKDTSKTRNFHLVGNGVDRRTKVPGTGTRTWDVYLTAGTYVYKSDRNTKLRGTIKVMGGPPA
jgi:hypothetical protein